MGSDKKKAQLEAFITDIQFEKEEPARYSVGNVWYYDVKGYEKAPVNGIIRLRDVTIDNDSITLVSRIIKKSNIIGSKLKITIEAIDEGENNYNPIAYI